MQLNKKITIGYLSGPVDAREVYRAWKQKKPINYLGTSYLTEFFEVMNTLNCRGIVWTSKGKEYYESIHPDITIINLPKPREKGGLNYHIKNCAWTYKSIRTLVSQGSQIIILTDAQNYWFTTILFRLRGVTFVNALHTAIWPAFRKLTLSEHVLRIMNSVFHYIWGDHSLAASYLVDNQLRKISFGRINEGRVFLPTYDINDFILLDANLSFDPNIPVRILYAGRITRDKGIFDLIKTAKILVESDVQIAIDVCGDGIDFQQAKKFSRDQGVESLMNFHGFCGREDMVRLLRDCYCVIVPTRAELGEGFAMIAAEGVLAGKPVVTSRVVPALEYVRAAVLEAIPDCPVSYAEAITKISNDRAVYKAKVKGALKCREMFLDPKNGYRALLLETFKAMRIRDL